MADDEAHRLPVGRDEVLHAALEVGVVEHLRRQVERVVVARVVERIAHRARILLHGSRLILHAASGWHNSSSSCSSSTASSRSASGISETSCGIIESSRSRSGTNCLHIVGHGVDAVQRVEHRAQWTSTAGCCSSAVPSTGSFEGDGRSRRNWRCCPVIRRCRRSCLWSWRPSSAWCPPSASSGSTSISSVSMFVCISSAWTSMLAIRSWLYLRVICLTGALHAEQERDRRVLDRLARWPGDRLHPGDPWHAKDRPWRSCR